MPLPYLQIYGPSPVVKGRVAYVPQTPFIIHGSIRDNILFGQPYNAHRYEQCIRATCLDTDLRLVFVYFVMVSFDMMIIMYDMFVFLFFLEF